MILLTPEQKMKQNKLIYNLKQDINKLHFKIEHQTLQKIKANIIKNIKINICKGRLFAPYFITAGLCIGIGSAIGATPFVPDKEKNYMKIMEEEDSLGNIKYEQQYEEFSNFSNTITYYDKWSMNSDGKYYRKVTIYNMGDFSKDRIEKILDGNYNTSLEDLFGQPIVNRTEIKNNLSELEKETDSYIQARYYSKSEDDYIFVNESIKDNILETIVWIIAFIFFEECIYLYRSCFPFNYKEKLDKIYKKYSMENIDNILKKLEIRESNYKRLTNFSGSEIFLNKQVDIKGKISGDIFEYLVPNSCDKFSDIDGLELQRLFVLLDELYLQIRPILNIDQEETFGYEIELEKANFEFIYEKIISLHFFDKWILKFDGSLQNGIEINSPILHNTKQCWSDLDRLCVAIQKGGTIGKNSAGHIHLGTQLLGDEPRVWKNFIKLYSTYENVIFRFIYGEFLTNRTSLMKYASPISIELWNDYLQLKDKDVSIEEIIKKISHGKYKAINFENVNVERINEFIERNTIEVRGANDTKESAIHQNNYNLLAHMGIYARSEKFNDRIIDKRHEINNSKYNDLDWYNEIYLEQALELCDLIFDNNLDKIYFLKQYLKSFEISHNEFCRIKKPLTKAIKY